MIALSAAGGVLILASAKLGFDWYLWQQDQLMRPTSAGLEKMLAEANEAQSRPDQPRDCRLPDDLRAALKSWADFRVSYRVADIPDSARAAFVRSSSEDAFRMAERGGRWEATDVIRDPYLPRRRLIAVAISKSFCLLFYEHGGIGRSNNVVAFRLLGDRAETIWHAYLASGVADLTALHEALGGKQVLVSPFL